MEEINDEEKKDVKIEIVKGNPRDLNISEVKDNLSFEVRDEQPPKKVIVPENQKNSNEANED